MCAFTLKRRERRDMLEKSLPHVYALRVKSPFAQHLRAVVAVQSSLLRTLVRLNSLAAFSPTGVA
jgi:hypothetical protein